MTLTDSPRILVFAGPNGSGKSTIYANYSCFGLYINADDIKRDRNLTDLEAAQEAEKLREWCLSQKKDFTFETVLSTNRNLDLLDEAKKAGYYIKSVFVLTADAEINVFRIKSRVQSGGHDVPADKIRSRYEKALANLPDLIRLSDECYVIDNTDNPHMIFVKNNGTLTAIESPHWSWARVMALCAPAGPRPHREPDLPEIVISDKLIS
jgi:predicted ABC-type ATPase